MPDIKSTALATTILIAANALALLFIWRMGRRLAPRHGGDIRLMGFFFWLTAIATVLIALWAKSTGAVDSHGVFQGKVGASLNRLLRVMLDLDGALNVFGGLFLLVVGPAGARDGAVGMRAPPSPWPAPVRACCSWPSW
jgi:hypothetical protein